MANNTYTKNYADGAALTEAKLDSAYQSLKLDIAQTTQMTQGATAGHYLKCVTPGAAAQFAALPDSRGIATLRNIGLKCTAATGALVFTLTTGAGSVPSSSDPATISFSSNGSTQATLQSIDVTSSKTFTLTASASLGTQSTSASFIYLYAMKTSTSSSGVIMGVSRKGDFDYGDAITTAAVSSSADSADVLYATAATSVIPRLIGVITAARNSTGSWQTPSKVNITSGMGRMSPASDWQSRNSITGTGTTVKAGGVALSASSGSYSTSSTSAAAVTNLSVTITTTGRPVLITCIPAGNNSSAHIVATGSGVRTYIRRDSTDISQQNIGDNSTINLFIPTSVITAVDFPAAGTYTYTVRMLSTSGGSCSFFHSKLLAYEL